MKDTLVALIFFIVGMINFVPIVGALSAGYLEQLYQVRIKGPEIELLLRHRAILFGIVGGVLIGAAFFPSIQVLAWIAGIVSMLSFIILFLLVGSNSEALMRILWIDVFAIFLLILVPVLRAI